MKYLMMLVLASTLAACGDTNISSTGANSTISLDGSSGTISDNDSKSTTTPSEESGECSEKSHEEGIC